MAINLICFIFKNEAISLIAGTLITFFISAYLSGKPLSVDTLLGKISLVIYHMFPALTMEIFSYNQIYGIDKLTLSIFYSF